MKLPLTCFLALATLLGHCVRSEAGLVVSVSDATVTAGSSPLMLDVFVSSTGTDLLAVTNLSFSVSGPNGSMQFESQPAGQSPFLSDPGNPPGTPGYVFYGDSAANGDGDLGGLASLFGNASPPPPASNPYTTFIGGDSTADGLDVTVSQTYLLAVLVLDVPTLTIGTGNNTYVVTLNNPTMSFMNSNGGNTPFDTTDSKLTGTITVQPANAVPEPATWQLALSATALSVLFAWRRRTRPAAR